MEKLIIDPGTLLSTDKGEDSKGFFFATASLSSLIEFQKHRYQIFLISTGNGLHKQIAWGKKFLAREKIKFSSIPLNKLKSPPPKPGSIQTGKVFYALTKFIAYQLSLSVPKSHVSTCFFTHSPTTGSLLLPCRDWHQFTEMILHPARRAKVIRKTHETDIRVQLNLDGNGTAKIKTGLNFLNHMLTNFCKHSGIDMVLSVKGDLEVDEHHTIEDTALAMGECLHKAMGNKKGMERYGFVLPMDESEAACSIDFSGRSHLEWNAPAFKREYVGDFPTEMLQHFYNSFCLASGLNMNLKLVGKNEHHLIESSFKSLARCLRQALRVTGNDIPSTKGSL